MINRRQFLAAGTAALAGLSTQRSRASGRMRNRTDLDRIPLIHTTDLYDPPQDPDDHFDLATAVALEEFDLKGVVLDATERFLNPSAGDSVIKRDPGFIPVAQMGYLLGQVIPVAVGPRFPLKSPHDDIADRPAQEQAGVRLLLDTLEHASSKVTVSVVGSCRVVTAAYNRNPGLLQSKIRSILLNAGSTGGTKPEWNVGLDVEAYQGLWNSGLPILWYPCETGQGSLSLDDERGTYWKASHEMLLQGIAPSLRSWFTYALTASKRSDIIRVLSEEPTEAEWRSILAQDRNMWSTASLVMAAGRVLANTSQGWRFIPAEAARSLEVWPWRLDPIRAIVDEKAQVAWSPAGEKGTAYLFGRDKKPGFGSAMGEALNALLRSVPL